jgi:hypothetical protein
MQWRLGMDGITEFNFFFFTFGRWVLNYNVVRTCFIPEVTGYSYG